MFPKVMATQHPDSVVEVRVEEEVDEAILDLTPIEAGGRDCDEKMIDYEGKLTPYHQVKWIIKEAKKRGLKLGDGALITPRLPSMKLEDPDRHLLALISSISANSFSEEKPVKYIIYPMSEPSEIRRLSLRIRKLVDFLRRELGDVGDIRVIPLLEDIDELLGVERYASILSPGNRIMLGKSDAALKSGHFASTIAMLFALEKSWRLGLKPIVGVGKPPMRGHLREGNEDEFASLYSGYFTVTAQSALRLQTQPDGYKRVILKLKESAGREPRGVDEELLEVIPAFEHSWRSAIADMAQKVVTFAEHVPSTRARMTGYLRTVNGVRLPRAIKFAASLYSMGVGPFVLEFLIAIKRGLWKKMSEIIEEIPELLVDLAFDASLTYPGVAMRNGLILNFSELRKYVDIEFGTDEDYEALLVVASRKVRKGEKAIEEIAELARMRGFLG